MDQRIIYETAEGGVCVVVPVLECGLPLQEIAARSIPDGVQYEVVPTEAIPSDRTFRNAWKKTGKAVEVDVPKAKLIAHDKRRKMREAEFAPYDDVIMKQIPGKDAAAAEASRAAIRDKYAVMQTAIDAAQTPDEIRAALQGATE